MRIEKRIAMKAAPQMVRRLRARNATISGLMKEYHSAYSTIMAAVFSLVSQVEYERIRGRIFSRGGRRTCFKSGHKTWNAGMAGLVIPGSEKGWFKEGHAPHSHTLRHRVHARIMTDLPAIVHRLRSGPATIDRLIKEYHCDYYTLMRYLLTVISPAEYHRIRQAIYLRANNRNAVRSVRRHNYLDGDDRPIPQDISQALQTLYQTISWWECIGCGYDFQSEPEFNCPTCGGLRFAIVRQKRTAV